MKTTIAIMMYYMECGGVEKALINLLDQLDPDKYVIDLFLLERKGEFLEQIPAYVNQRVLPITELERKLIVSVSIRETVRLGLRNKDYIRTLLLTLQYAFRKIAGSCAPAYQTGLSRLKCKTYDIALDFHGYLSLTTVFLADKIVAKKKYTWIHSEGIIPSVSSMEEYFHKYDKIVCVSEKCCKLMRENLSSFDRKRICVIKNFINVQEIRRMAFSNPEFEWPGDGLRLLTVGRLSVPKGYDFAIEVARHLKQNGIKFQWLFCGEGSMRQNLEALIEKHHLKEEVYLLGYCDNPYAYMASCDIYVQPSRYEGYAVTVTEAVALGCAVVSTDVSGASEEIINKQNGIITPISAQGIYDGIMGLIREPKKLQDMRNNLPSKNHNKDTKVLLDQLLEIN